MIFKSNRGELLVKVISALGIIALWLCAATLPNVGNAAIVLGTPSANPSFGTRSCGDCGVSTNELNALSQAPGHEGQDAPYVSQVGGGPGEIELFFSNLAPGVAFFERRINGQAAGSTAHPIILGSTIHPGTSVSSGNTAQVLFSIPEGGILDIRLALGGERDWDFDWTSFEVEPSAVPLPAALPLLLAGLCALGFVTRRRRA